MDCAEFQRKLPEFMESGGNPEESRHLQSCAVCSDLLQDLRYIAEAAKLLVPMEDPSPKVWDGIQNSLRREGLLRPAGGPERLEPFLVQDAARGNFFRWAFATTAVLVVLALVAYQAITRNQAPGVGHGQVSNTAASAASGFDDADQQVLSEVNEHAPQMKADYEKSMLSVNAYIRDAKQHAAESPNDADAQNELMNAYEQKAALYEMASTAP
jgi:hypothetical protein